MDTFSRTINGEKISDRQPDLFTGGRLRDYQLEGMEWLKVGDGFSYVSYTTDQVMTKNICGCACE